MKTLTINDLIRDGIYFFFKEKTVSQISVCMGESLDEAGIPIFSNINLYEKPYDNHSFLFKKDINSPKDAALILVDLSFMDNKGLEFVQLPQELISNQHKIIFISSSDISAHIVPARIVYFTNETIPFISTHENKFYRPFFNPRIPFGFGIKKADLYQVHKYQNQHFNRKRIMLRNFVNTSYQDVRHSLDLFFIPHLLENFTIDFDINYSNHYSRLSDYFFCLTYCGTYAADPFQQKDSYFSHRYERLGKYLKNPVIFRWDSYRTGQAMASGCIAIHLDYDECGFKLQYPSPKNWAEYIGISPKNIMNDIKRINQLTDQNLYEISESGKNWFIDRFSPANLSNIVIDILLNPPKYFI